MTIRAIVVLSVALFGSLAFAAVEGRWSGETTYTNSEDSIIRKGMVHLTLTNDGNGNLVFEHDYLHVIWNFTVSGEDVFLDGGLVGKLTDDLFSASFANSKDTSCKYKYSLTSSGQYVDHYFCAADSFDHIEGVLTREP